MPLIKENGTNFQWALKAKARFEDLRNSEKVKTLQRAYQKNPLQFLSKAALWAALLILFYVFVTEALTAYERLKPLESPVEKFIKPATRISSLPVPEIINAHLFGNMTIQPKTSTAVEEDALLSAPTTTLSLTLRGVFTSEDKEGGSAIIGEQEGGDKFYKINAVVPGPAILRQIYEDRVVLEYQGRLESLWLYEPTDKEPGAHAAHRKPKQSDKETVFPSRSSRTIDKRSDKKLSKLLSNYHALLHTEPMQLLTVLRFYPAEVKGEMVGFRVGPGIKKEDFTALGLKENDIVTAVNGIPLDSLNKGMELFEQVKNASEVTLDLKRGGQAVRYIYSLK